VIVKATLTHLETLESMSVSWNPRSYRLTRSHRLAAPAVLGGGPAPVELCAGGEERFATRLLLDSTEASGPERDLRLQVERLDRWSAAGGGRLLPPRLLFLWGSFRFRGVIESLAQEWVLFDADGTPLRAWVDLVLRR
jgi:hypothetical protein